MHMNCYIKTRNANSMVLMEALFLYIQSYLCLPLDAVLLFFSFFMYNVFKVSYTCRPGGQGVKFMLIVVDITL